MSIEVGTYGIWQRSGAIDPEAARELETLGFGALWIGGSPEGRLAEVDPILEASQSLVVATGIVNIWRDDAATVARSYHRINERYPNRFLLGVGIGHPEATPEYRSPYDTIVSYIHDLDKAGVPREHVALAALGPKVLRLSGDRTTGAHPYLTTPRHTEFARDVLGEGPLLAPEQTVVVGLGSDESQEVAANFVSRYLRLVNYRNNLLREGWDEAELTDGGSERLVSELVLSGGVEAVAEGIRGHVAAGADHVCIQDIGPDPMASYRTLAGALLE